LQKVSSLNLFQYVLLINWLYIFQV